MRRRAFSIGFPAASRASATFYHRLEQSNASPSRRRVIFLRPGKPFRQDLRVRLFQAVVRVLRQIGRNAIALGDRIANKLDGLTQFVVRLGTTKTQEPAAGRPETFA